MKVVKQLLFTWVCTSIFFLTGCAGGRYHNDRGQIGSSGSVTYNPMAASGSFFSWPMHGNIRVPFGQKEEGVTLKGIVISGREGDVVQAVSDGFVAYTDPSLRGFGQTIVVDHRNGFSSVYARTASLLVVPGQEVRRGQAIAKLGSSGKGAQPELYLEIRNNSKPENPLHFLR